MKDMTAQEIALVHGGLTLDFGKLYNTAVSIVSSLPKYVNLLKAGLDFIGNVRIIFGK